MSRDDRRRGGSSSSTKLRMDSSSSQSKSHGDSSSKRKELDNVMRKARESQSSYWNKKLLEVEEKDPNRWRHSGYKEMYIGGISTNNSKFHQRSPKHRSPHPRSPRPRSPRSPRIRSPLRPRSRTPRNRNSRSPRRRSPRITNSFILKPRSPIIRRSNTPKTRSPKVRRSHTPKPRSPKTQRNQANNAQSRITKSPSSGSTCSDHSCSVCSPKDHRQIVNRRLSQSRSSSPARQRLPTKEVASLISRVGTSKTSRPRSPPIPRPQTPPPMPQPPSHHPKEYNKLTKDLKARKKESHRNKLADDPRVPDSVQMMHKHVKLEKTHNMHPDVSMIHPPAESSGTDDSDSSSVTSHAPPPKMTLSERFGKMAQWSVDRRDMENMRITKVGNSTMKVVIEGEERIARLGYDSPPPGHYPESLLTQGPRGLECWDDVRINFDDCQTDSITTNLQSELAALTYQRDKLTTEIQEIKSKLRLRDSEITQLQEEIDYLREQAVRQNVVLCSFKKQIQEKECLEMQYKVSEREVTEFRDKIVNYKRKIDNLSSTINLQDVLICQLKDELRNRDEKIQELLNELNQLQESLASLISCPNRYVESNENAIKERIHEILKENQDNILV